MTDTNVLNEDKFIQYENLSLVEINSEDYGYALLHLAWLKNYESNIRLFSFIEMIPSEALEPKTCLRKSENFDSLGDIFYQRISLTVSEAILWYLDLRSGNSHVPESGEDILFMLENLTEEPKWPSLIYTNSLPFVSPGNAGVRCHLLMQQEQSPLLAKVIEYPKAVKFLSDIFLFDFLKYQEYLGACALVAYNPILRSVSCMLACDKETEYTDFNFVLRSNQDYQGIQLLVTDFRPLGLTNYQVIEVKKPFIRVRHPLGVEKVGFSVISNRHGLLIDSSPAHFVRSVQINMGILGNTKIVEVPVAAKDKNRSSTSYKVPLYDDSERLSVIGNEVELNSAVKSLYQGIRQREKLELAGKLGQKWFHGNQQEAIDFIRSLIGKAYKKVLIVDPYFSTIEIFQFALATTRSNIQLKIISSGIKIKKDDDIQEDKSTGEVILSQLESFEKQGLKIEFLVMTGEKPIIHDRFLIIDNDVWLSGNSLNNIGERAGMMIKIPNGEYVIQMIENLQKDKRIQTLKEWLDKRKAMQKIN